MNALLYQVARLSMTAGWMTLLLVLLRPLLRKVPRRFSCLLWALVGVRLMLPFSLESRASLVPQSIAAPEILVDSNPALRLAVTAPVVSAVPALSRLDILPWIWAAGVAAMAIYAAVSFLRLHRKVQVSMRESGNVYLCDSIPSPFVMGIIKPRIYLPSGMEEQLRESVLSHERAHLRRGDHLWKPLGYCLLAIYWFNPLCWLAYALFCRDMEQACDEAVIRGLDSTGKKHYSAALLACAIPRSSITACPLAFGEVGVKQRIQGILNYRKPPFWVILATVVLCIGLAIGCLTDPVQADPIYSGHPAGAQDTPSETLSAECTLYNSPAEFSRVIAVLKAGTEVTVLRTDTIGSSIWKFVQASDLTGWIRWEDAGTDFPTSTQSQPDTSTQHAASNRITILHDTIYLPPDRIVYLPPEDTDIHTSPSDSSQAIGTLKAEERLPLTQIKIVDGIQWAYIQYEGISGWVKCSESLFSTSPDSSRDASQAELIPELSPTGGAYTLSQETPLYKVPNSTRQALTTLEAGVQVALLRFESIAGVQWAYVQYEGVTGWVTYEDGLFGGSSNGSGEVSQAEPIPERGPTGITADTP